MLRTLTVKLRRLRLITLTVKLRRVRPRALRFKLWVLMSGLAN